MAELQQQLVLAVLAGQRRAEGLQWESAALQQQVLDAGAGVETVRCVQLRLCLCVRAWPAA